MKDITDNVERIKNICRDVSENIYTKNPPSQEYAQSIFELLIGTCAQESSMKYRRQLGFSRNSTVGAFSLFQLERTSIMEGFEMIKKNPDLFDRCNNLFRKYNFNVPSDSMKSILLYLQEPSGDLLGGILCRLHYQRRPGSIPSELLGQASYWKKYYNTSLGRGTIGEYINNYKKYVEPYI